MLTQRNVREGTSGYPADPWHVFYGRGVWPLGESADEGVMIEGADRRSYAALSRYLGEADLPRDDLPTIEVRYLRRLYDSCGCTPEQHERHTESLSGMCVECPHWGLPPCEPELFSWMPEFGEGGLPLLWCEW